MFKDRVQWFLKITTSNVSGKIGSIIVFGFIIISLIVAVGGTSVCPYNPIETNVGPMLGSPSWENFFGTDRLGRDLFSRVLYATPNALFVSVSIIGSALIIGVLLGSFSAYHGGIIDDLLMRITDLFFALPGLIMSIAISVYLGPGIINMMYALMMFWWPAFARMARGEALRIAQFEFIEAARAAGLSSFKIVIKHIIPNLMTTMILYATIDFGQVIMVYAGLSYLGLSVQPPWPDWGAMVNQYQGYLIAAPWLALLPGAMIAIVVIGFGLLGDGVRDVIESRI